MTLIEGEGPGDRRYWWLPEMAIPDADGVLVWEQPCADESGRLGLGADFWPIAAADLVEAAVCSAMQPGVLMVTVHRREAGRLPTRLATVVGLRHAARSGRRGLVVNGSPLLDADVTARGRRLAVHDVLLWHGDLWESHRVWEAMTPDGYGEWISRRRVLGLNGP